MNSFYEFMVTNSFYVSTITNSFSQIHFVNLLIFGKVNTNWHEFVLVCFCEISVMLQMACTSTICTILSEVLVTQYRNLSFMYERPEELYTCVFW